MIQTDVPAGAAGPARFCSACGGPLSFAAGRCPRCGAVITAQGKAERSRATLVIIVVAVAVLGALPCIGILAAIAIPNFLRYQLRSKEAGATAELHALVRAEQQSVVATGHYVPLQALPARPPGANKQRLSPEDLQLAAGMGWDVEPLTYGQFRVAVAEDASGREAASVCMETDLDGDGMRAAHVAFLPVEGTAPPAPCTTPVPYDPQYAEGVPAKITERNVY